MSARTPAIGTVLRLHKVQSLIRQTNYKAARALLTPDGKLPEDDTELHTLAALTTREGDYDQAIPLWRALLQRQPRHEEAQRMLASIELWQNLPPWHRYLIPGAAALGCITLLIVIMALTASPSAPAAAIPPTAANPISDPAASTYKKPTPAPVDLPPPIQFSTQPAPKAKPRSTR